MRNQTLWQMLWGHQAPPMTIEQLDEQIAFERAELYLIDYEEKLPDSFKSKSRGG